jgi:hypothetical protein
VSFTIDIAGRHVPWTLLLAAIAALVCIVFIILSAFSKGKYPKSGMRATERNLLVSSIALAAAWLLAFDGLSLFRAKSAATEASAMANSGSTASCASLTTGMSSSQVTSKAGKPDQVINDEKTRGPGAETWIYKGSRCAVHLLDEKVQAVE